MEKLLERKKNGQNIAKSEQSSHTPGGSHQRPYHFKSLEGKKNAQIKGLISNVTVATFFVEGGLSVIRERDVLTRIASK